MLVVCLCFMDFIAVEIGTVLQSVSLLEDSQRDQVAMFSGFRRGSGYLLIVLLCSSLFPREMATVLHLLVRWMAW